MKTKLFFFLTFGVMLLVAFPAQGANTWTTKRECVVQKKERQPWGGNILFTDWAGIHGLSAQLKTPYVAAFIREGILGSPGLSPDGRWFGVAVGQITQLDYYNQEHHITAIRVYSTEDTKLIYEIKWNYNITFYLKYRQMQWLDNQRIVLDSADGIKVLDFKSGIFTTWESSVDLLDTEINYSPSIYPAPALQRAVRRNYLVKEKNSANTWEVVDVPTGRVLNTINTPHLPEIRWSANSTHFIAEIKTPSGIQMAFFDRDGISADTPFTIPDGRRIIWTPSNQYSSSAWSPDERYFAFLTSLPITETYRSMRLRDDAILYIADFKTHTLIDTCVSNVSLDMVWSPNSRLLALDGTPSNPYQRKTPIYLLDIQKREMFPITYHSVIDSVLIGWR